MPICGEIPLRKILLLVPKGNGPGNHKKCNKDWPDELEQLIDKNLWKIVTPGILVIASLIDRGKYEVELIDEEFQNINPENRYDIVAMYIVTPTAKRGYHWAQHFRSMGAYVVMGGVHTSMCPDEASQYCDTVFTGEAEYTWPQFLADYEKNQPRPRYAQSVGQADITASPVPAFQLIPGAARRIIPVQTARGCPHGCKFCNLRGLYGQTYRAKTIPQVRREIESVLQLGGKPVIYFTDDNFFCNPERSRAFMEEIREYKLTWYTHSDISLGKEEPLLELAFSSGCRQVLIGLESINSADLSGIDENNFKSRHAKDYLELINRIQSHGIGVVGSFIVGLDHDDARTFEKLYDFITASHLFGASITVNTPYPGTRLYEEAGRNGWIESHDWDEYTIFQPVCKTKDLPPAEFNREYVRLLERIHSPANILRKINYFKEQLKKMNGKKP